MSSITTWSEFQSAFLAAFLAEDYEDELAERVRHRIQGEKESIRDFAFTYRALCKRWKPSLTEADIVKMILKNIKPYLASHLRSRVNTVEELVRLGHQLEKDHEQQKQCDGKAGTKSFEATPRGVTSTQPAVQWRRCKGFHAPGTCPYFISPAQLSQTSGNQSHSNKRNFHSTKQPGQPSNNSVTSTFTKNSQTCSDKPIATVTSGGTYNIPKNPVSVPQQLIVPVSVGSWTGKAIVDTGASYTLIHETLGKNFVQSPNDLQPWTLGRLYLANGEAEVPLGWLNIEFNLHDQVFTKPPVVLAPKALAYTVVLGLDFIFFSGLQINVIDKMYTFKSAPDVEYPFQPSSTSVPDNRPRKGKHQGNTNQSVSLLSSIPPPQPTLIFSTEEMDIQNLIDNAVNKAHLPADRKSQLRQLLKDNPQVCALRPGCTDVLQHRIYLTQQVPIK